MATFTLKTYSSKKELETFTHRSKTKLLSILTHPKHTNPEIADPWGTDKENYPSKFVILDSVNFKLFEGDITQTLDFVRNLK